MNRTPIPIVLDIDNALTLPVQDTDDAMALALSLTSPEVELLGVTACAGNCRTRDSVVNTLRMLEAAGANGIPVAAGRERPFLQDIEPHFQYLDSKTQSRQNVYWADLEKPAPPSRPPSSMKAHELLLKAIGSRPKEVVIVALGSLTNLALALLVEPEAAPNIREVVHMGGTLDEDGFVWSTPDIADDTWRTTLRFNTAFDPEASEIVFRSGIPITLVPANVTVKVFQYLEDIDGIAAVDTPFHRFLARWGRPWVEWSLNERKLPGAHMHDPLTLSVLIRPEFFSFEQMGIDLTAFRSGESWLSREKEQGPIARVATHVKRQAFEAFLLTRLCSPVLNRYREAPAL